MTPNVSRAAALAGLAVLGLAALVALAVTARGGEFEDLDWRVAGTLVAGLFCGSSALAALRFATPYRLVAVLPLATFVLVALAIWINRVWDENTELIAKALVTGLALTLAVLLVAGLRMQTPFTSAQVWIAYIGISALIALTTLLGLVLLWTWDAPFLDGGEGRNENVANIAQRILLALFTLSVVAYLALPLATRLLSARTERDH